jgi:hypothetical protein
MAASGSVAARLEGSIGPGTGSVRGRVQVGDADLRGPGLEVRGLNADLPFDLSWSRPDAAAPLSLSGPRLVGSLRFTSAAAGGLSVPATAAGLVVEADRVTLDQSLAIPLLGGQVGLGELALADLLRPTRHLATSVELRGISLAEASRALGLPPLEGSLDGAFPRVRLTPTTLHVDGIGQLALFGGRVEVSAISGQDVLGRYPRLLFDARLADLDLARLTQTFDFGKVTGILAGEISGCELFRFVPVRFSGELHTVAVPGSRSGSTSRRSTTSPSSAPAAGSAASALASCAVSSPATPTRRSGCRWSWTRTASSCAGSSTGGTASFSCAAAFRSASTWSTSSPGRPSPSGPWSTACATLTSLVCKPNLEAGRNPP